MSTVLKFGIFEIEGSQYILIGTLIVNFILAEIFCKNEILANFEQIPMNKLVPAKSLIRTIKFHHFECFCFLLSIRFLLNFDW